MPLQDLVGLRQPNAAAVSLGGEIQLKNLLLDLGWDAVPLVLNPGEDHVLLAARRDGKVPALRHSLQSVQHNVEDGLLHEVNIDVDRERHRRKFACDRDTVLRRIGRGQHGNLFEQAAKVDFLQMQFPGAHEVHQDLHHPIQAVDLAVNNVDVAARVGISLLQLVLQQLQMQNDGIDRILDFVSHAAGQPPAGR